MILSALGLNWKGYLIAGAAGFVLSGVVTAGVTIKAYETWIVPGRIEAAEERVRRDVEERIAAASRAAAEKARADERQRQQEAAQAALKEYQDAVAAREQEAADRLAQLEEENRDYAAKLRASGNSCPLDDSALRFLRGLPDNTTD